MKNSFAAKYIGPLLTWSLVIHIVYILACLLLIATQDIWMKQMYPEFNGYEFIFPAASFSWTLIRFALHFLLVLFMLRRLISPQEGSPAAVIGFIYLGAGFLSGFQVVDSVIRFCLKASVISADYRDCLSGFYVIWGWLSPLLRISMLLFLIGCAMNWYYKENNCVLA